MNLAGVIACPLVARLCRIFRRIDKRTFSRYFSASRHLADRRYQELFENSSDAIFVVKVVAVGQFRFESLNPAAMQALTQAGLGINNFGMSNSCMPRPPVPLPDIPENIVMRLGQCLATGLPVKYESELASQPEDEPGIYDISLIPMADDNGIDRIFGFARDISARKRYENMLHAREQEFRALAENSPDIIIRYDRDCRRTYVNPAYKQLNKTTAQEVPGKTPAECLTFPNFFSDFYQEKIKEVLQTGANIAFDHEWQTRDGAQRCHFLRAVPEYDRDSRIIGALAILRDITALKDTERRLKKSQDQLRALAIRRNAEQEEERKLIAREMHEELGQTLATLRMNISALRISSETGPSSRLDQMLPLLDDAIGMVRNITSTLRPKVLDMGIQYALEWLTEEFTLYTGIQCQLRIDERELVYPDEKRTRTIFSIVQESLDNVMRHAEANLVDVVLEQCGDDYCLEVRDDGKGFDLSSLKDQSLGLIDIREQLLALGGTMQLSSTPNHGTVLQARIPIEEKIRGKQ